MIETALQITKNDYTSRAHPTQKVLRMVHNERMGGSVPMWETVKTDQQNIEANLSNAQNGTKTISKDAFAYSRASHSADTQQSAAFGFGDLIDMVNPLHHIPVLGYAYRELTGDQIRPIGQVIGGGLYGGALGAASGLINAIVQEETGKSIEGNAISIAFGRNENSAKHPAQPDPEITTALLSFSDLGNQNDIITDRLVASTEKKSANHNRRTYNA